MKNNSIQKTIEAKIIYKRVTRFAKIMDDYGIDVIVGLIPGIGDITIGAISTIFLLQQGSKIGLAEKDMIKILGYQGIDILIGAIPVLGDVTDYFYKANKKSAYLFKKHLDTLTKEAINNGTIIEG